MGIWRGFKIGLTIIGITIRVGFASGREIHLEIKYRALRFHSFPF
jgi:hypothetical protein